MSDMLRMISCHQLALVGLVAIVETVGATPLLISFDDPVGDAFGTFPADVVNLTMEFDNTNGNYELLMQSTDADPFTGQFRVNVNLFNPDTGTTAHNPSVFQETVNDFNLQSSTTTLLLSGTNSHLRAWDEGDRVASHSLRGAGLGNPDGTSLFRTSSGRGGFLQNEDAIGDAPGFGVATIMRAAAFPEPPRPDPALTNPALPKPSRSEVFVPDGLNPGDSYHLVFVTDGMRNPAAADIADYNTFVQAEAERPSAITEHLGVDWFAIGSTATVDARDNALVEAPVYLLDGITKVADGFGDMWDGAFGASINVNQFGNSPTRHAVFTGTEADGRRPPDFYLGSPSGAFVAGHLSLEPFHVYSRFEGAHMFALSEMLTVPPHLMAGDANQDLNYDQLDLVQVLLAGKYLTGEAVTWGEGDWDGAPGGYPGNPPEGDGVFNQFDIIAALGCNYLTGPYAATKPNDSDNDGDVTVVYDAHTGEFGVEATSGTKLTSINIDSASGIFTGNSPANLGGNFDNDSDTNLFKATVGGSFGSLSFGSAAQPGLSREFLLNDLSVMGSLASGGDLDDIELIYVPEPASVVLAIFAGTVALFPFVKYPSSNSRDVSSEKKVGSHRPEYYAGSRCHDNRYRDEIRRG